MAYGTNTRSNYSPSHQPPRFKSYQEKSPGCGRFARGKGSPGWERATCTGSVAWSGREAKTATPVANAVLA
jgi:hypothetical protein